MSSLLWGIFQISFSLTYSHSLASNLENNELPSVLSAKGTPMHFFTISFPIFTKWGCFSSSPSLNAHSSSPVARKMNQNGVMHQVKLQRIDEEGDEQYRPTRTWHVATFFYFSLSFLSLRFFFFFSFSIYFFYFVFFLFSLFFLYYILFVVDVF